MESVIVWGIGDRYKEVLTEIQNKYDIKYLVDSNVEYWNKEIDGYKVIAPYEITKYSVDKYIITVQSTKEFNEILNCLRRLNIKLNKIVFDYCGKHIKIPLKEIFIRAHDFKNGLCKEGFLLYQIIINYLTIERCYANYENMDDDEIFMLHHTFMHFRDSKIVLEKKEGVQALIKDFEKNSTNGMAGYPITIDRYGKMIDGHHRVALYLFHNIPEIDAIVFDEIKNPLVFDIKFLKNAFPAISKGEFENITKCYEKIYEKIMKKSSIT